MTKRELLESKYHDACHNLMCYSKNYTKTEPIPGYERAWKKSFEQCELLKAMMNELPHGSNNELVFIGTIASFSVSVSKDKQEQFIESLIVCDKEDNRRMFTIDYEAGKDLLDAYDKERHNRYDIGKNTDIVFTVNNFSQRIIRWEWKVK